MPPVHYQPDSFPPEDRLDWHRLMPLIGPAAAAVARYDSLLRTVPNPRATLAALRVQEAVSSSRIENIFTTVTEVLEMDAGLEPANPYAREDAREVLNCLAAERRAGGDAHRAAPVPARDPRSARPAARRRPGPRKVSRRIPSHARLDRRGRDRPPRPQPSCPPRLSRSPTA